MTDLALAPEIEREVRKLRESWSEEERQTRRECRPALPETFARPEAIQAHRLRLEFEGRPRPDWLKPFKLKPVAPEKPAKPNHDGLRPTSEIIADILARLSGSAGGAV